MTGASGGLRKRSLGHGKGCTARAGVWEQQAVTGVAEQELAAKACPTTLARTRAAGGHGGSPSPGIELLPGAEDRLSLRRAIPWGIRAVLPCRRRVRGIKQYMCKN